MHHEWKDIINFSQKYIFSSKSYYFFWLHVITVHIFYRNSFFSRCVKCRFNLYCSGPFYEWVRVDRGVEDSYADCLNILRKNARKNDITNKSSLQKMLISYGIYQHILRIFFHYLLLVRPCILQSRLTPNSLVYATTKLDINSVLLHMGCRICSKSIKLSYRNNQVKR